MAFNGSGVFVRLYSWVNDATSNIKIRADRMDNEMNGIATGLSSCITKDGQTTVTANLPMATFRHTNVGNGASRTDYSSVGQVQDGKINWVDGGGTADAITAGYSIPITALVDGQICYVRATAANTTTTPTFSPNGLTARTIVKNGGSALVVGDISGDGHELVLRYDLSNTRWELLNPKTVLTSYVTLTGSETLTNKTLTNPIINAGSGTVVLPNTASPAQTAEGSIVWDSDDNLLTVGDGSSRKIMADTATAQTLTNKTLGSGTVAPAGWTIGRAFSTYTTNASLTTTIPRDDTIPQNTEGTEVLSQSYTPQFSNSRIRVTFMASGSASAALSIIAAMFIDSGANAVQATNAFIAATDYVHQISMTYEYAPGDTSAHTYKVRVGPHAAGTIRLNGSSSVRYFGGIMAATLVIEEIKQ